MTTSVPLINLTELSAILTQQESNPDLLTLANCNQAIYIFFDQRRAEKNILELLYKLKGADRILQELSGTLLPRRDKLRKVAIMLGEVIRYFLQFEKGNLVNKKQEPEKPKESKSQKETLL